MSKKCRREISSGIIHRLQQALVATAFTSVICISAHYDYFAATYVVENEEVQASEAAVVTEMTQLTDLTDAFAVILQGATKEFIAGYTIDDSFLMWLDATYGDAAIYQLANHVSAGTPDTSIWYEVTGSSIHVLWLSYCQYSGFQSYQLENVNWVDCRSQDEVVIRFSGDFNFADEWYTMQHLKGQMNGIYDCFSADLLQKMNDADVMMMNNEFVYSDNGTPLPGKDYTFEAYTASAKLLEVFGVDIVSLANNHVYDYGEAGLLDTMEQLEQMGIAYTGAGVNIDDASKIVYFVANGKKIAIVSATEIERSTKYTKEATEDSPGVFKTLDPERFIARIQEAKRTSDYVIAVVHWGTEGTLFADVSQRQKAVLFAEAGADAIIGGHPHRLQGIAFVENVPVAYSLGNFWFSDGTLYTTLAQITIKSDGTLQLNYQPCIQKDLTTSLITDKNEKDDFYSYLAAISQNIGIDEEGNVYNTLIEHPGVRIDYDSKTCRTPITGNYDNEGNAIDIVGNLKQ